MVVGHHRATRQGQNMLMRRMAKTNGRDVSMRSFSEHADDESFEL